MNNDLIHDFNNDFITDFNNDFNDNFNNDFNIDFNDDFNNDFIDFKDFNNDFNNDFKNDFNDDLNNNSIAMFVLEVLSARAPYSSGLQRMPKGLLKPLKTIKIVKPLKHNPDDNVHDM